MTSRSKVISLHKKHSAQSKSSPSKKKYILKNKYLFILDQKAPQIPSLHVLLCAPAPLVITNN